MCLAVSRALTSCQRMRGSLDHKGKKGGIKGGAGELEVLMEGPQPPTAHAQLSVMSQVRNSRELSEN